MVENKYMRQNKQNLIRTYCMCLQRARLMHIEISVCTGAWQATAQRLENGLQFTRSFASSTEF